MIGSNDKRLGPYEILAQLGAGGMGEVFRARDTRLGREVAVKVLPDSFKDNEDRLSRFDQEARAASALNHPNILSIYDIGIDDDTPYVVSELLEGETLREKMSGSPLQRRKAIDYALQTARGLAAAHEKGIIHRDLKPDNLFITRDGRVKILDFGLAKLTETSPLGEVGTEAPTRKVETDSGIVMGTVGYMSPEQVRGAQVDHRSDIFSFGTILYEMLTGKRAFRRETAVETLHSILKEDPPDLTESNQTISPALERIVNHCLEKDPKERFHSAKDLAFALEALSDTASVSSGQTLIPVTSGRRLLRRELIAWTLAGLAVLIAIAGIYAVWRWKGSSLTNVVSRFLLVAPEKMSYLGPPIISPDGRYVASRMQDDQGKSSLWIRPVDSLETQPLPGTEGGAQPFWSPDSRTVAFFADGKLKKIDISGGPPQTLCDSFPGLGGSWGRDGVIVFGKRPFQGLYRIQGSGGESTPVTTLNKDRKEDTHHWPYFLPDGRHFLFSAKDVAGADRGIYVASLDSDESKLILPGIDSSIAYTTPGYILFVREKTLVAQTFDVNKLEVTGEAFPVIDSIAFNVTNARAHFSVSDTGILVYRAHFPSLNSQLAWVDQTGKTLATVGDPGPKLAVELSRDKRRVAEVRADSSRAISDIWIVELERGAAATRFTLDPAADVEPVWSPDGNQIVFCSTRNGVPNIFRKLASGGASDEPLVRADGIALPTDWSPDGHYLLYMQRGQDTGMDLWLFPMTGDGEPILYLQTAYSETSGKFSPDGRKVAYVSNESGRNEVYIGEFPSSSARWQVSAAGGSQPRWRDDGKELFYVNDKTQLVSVDIKAAPNHFEVGIPKILFEIGRGFDRAGDSYDVSNDGQHFLIFLPQEEEQPSPFVVVKNWTDAIKR